MKNKLLWLMIGLLIVSILMMSWVICSGKWLGNEKNLEIVGDVTKNVAVTHWPDWTGKKKVSWQGDTYHAISLNKVLAEADILGSLEQIYFISHDGFTSAIDAADVGACYLSYDKKIGWSIIAPKHPISTNAKDLEKIVLVSKGEKSKALTIIKSDGSSQAFSLGQILAGTITIYPNFEGKAVVETNGKQYSSRVYTRSYGFPLSSLTAVNATDYLLLTNQDGVESFLKDGGHFNIEGKSVHYVDAKGQEVLKDIKQIRIYPYIPLNQ